MRMLHNHGLILLHLCVVPRASPATSRVYSLLMKMLEPVRSTKAALSTRHRAHEDRSIDLANPPKNIHRHLARNPNRVTAILLVQVTHDDTHTLSKSVSGLAYKDPSPRMLLLRSSPCLRSGIPRDLRWRLPPKLLARVAADWSSRCRHYDRHRSE